MRRIVLLTAVAATMAPFSAQAQDATLDRLSRELESVMADRSPARDVSYQQGGDLPPFQAAPGQPVPDRRLPGQGTREDAQNLGTLDSSSTVPEGYTGDVGTVTVGTIVRGYLNMTSISDYPGPWRGTLATPILSSDGHDVIAPAGATVVGVTRRSEGENAVLHNRMSFVPVAVTFDGRTLPLEGQFVVDQEGIAAIGDKVDPHFDVIFGSAAAGGVIDAIPDVAEALVNGDGDNGDVFLGESTRTSARFVQRYLDVVPTIEVRAGTPFQILFMQELTAPVYRPVERYRYVGAADVR